MDLKEIYSKDRKKMREASVSVLLQAVDEKAGMLGKVDFYLSLFPSCFPPPKK